MRCGVSERWADRSCSTGAFAAFVGARLNMPGAQISGETQLGVWLSQIGELDASDAKLLLQAELGQTFAHANRCFCGAALQRVPSDMTAHSSEVSSKGQSSSAGCVAAQATLRSDVDTTSARGSYPPSSSSAELSCLLPSAPGKTSAADAPSAKSASMVDNGVGDINALSLEQAVVMLLQVDGATSQEVLQSNFSAVFRHASICFCNNAQNEGNKREPSKLRGAGSSVAAPEPGAAALLGAASGAEAESKASGVAAGVKATSVDGGMKVEGSPVTPVDFSSAASIGASKSRSCAFCACGVQ